MRDHRSSWVSFFKRTLHRAIQQASIPRRNLLNIGTERPICAVGASIHSGLGSVLVAERFVMCAPQNQRRMVPKLMYGRCRLPNGLRSDGAGVFPLQGKILKKQDPDFVGLFIQIRMSDVTVHANKVKPSILDEGEIAAIVSPRN